MAGLKGVEDVNWLTYFPERFVEPQEDDGTNERAMANLMCKTFGGRLVEGDPDLWQL